MVLRLANFIELSCISVPIDRAFRRLMKIIASSIFPQLTHRVNIDFLETSAPIDSQNSSRTMSPRQRLHAMLLLYKTMPVRTSHSHHPGRHLCTTCRMRICVRRAPDIRSDPELNNRPYRTIRTDILRSLAQAWRLMACVAVETASLAVASPTLG